jgi:hypothetical protein
MLFLLPLIAGAEYDNPQTIGNDEKNDAGLVALNVAPDAIPVMGAVSYTWQSGGVNCVFTLIEYSCLGVIQVRCYDERATTWKESALSSPPAMGESAFGFNDMVVGEDYSQFQVMYSNTDSSCDDSEWVSVYAPLWTQPGKNDDPIETVFLGNN